MGIERSSTEKKKGGALEGAVPVVEFGEALRGEGNAEAFGGADAQTPLDTVPPGATKRGNEALQQMDQNEDSPDVVLGEGLDALEEREQNNANKRWRAEGKDAVKGVATHRGVVRTLDEMDQVLATGMRKTREAAAQEYIKSLLAFQDETRPDESFDIRNMEREPLHHNNEAPIRAHNAEHVAAERERSRRLFVQLVNEALQATRERAGDTTTQEDVAITLAGMLDRELNFAEEQQLAEIFSEVPARDVIEITPTPRTERGNEDRLTGKDADAAEAGQVISRRTRRVQRTGPSENLITGAELGELLKTPRVQGPTAPPPDEDRAEGFHDASAPEHSSQDQQKSPEENIQQNQPSAPEDVEHARVQAKREELQKEYDSLRLQAFMEERPFVEEAFALGVKGDLRGFEALRKKMADGNDELDFHLMQEAFSIGTQIWALENDLAQAVPPSSAPTAAPDTIPPKNDAPGDTDANPDPPESLDAQTAPDAIPGVNPDDAAEPDNAEARPTSMSQAEKEAQLRDDLAEIATLGGVSPTAEPHGTPDTTPLDDNAEPGTADAPPSPPALRDALTATLQENDPDSRTTMQLLRAVSGIDKTIEVDELRLREVVHTPEMLACMKNVLALRGPYVNAEPAFRKIEKEHVKLRKELRKNNPTAELDEERRVEEDRLRTEYNAAKEHYDTAVKEFALTLSSTLARSERGKDTEPGDIIRIDGETLAERTRRIQAQVLVNSLATLDRDLVQARVDKRNEGKNPRFLLNCWEWYRRLPPHYRIALSLGVSTAAIAGGAVTFGGLPALMGGAAIAKWGLPVALVRRAVIGGAAGGTSMTLGARLSKWRIDEYREKRQTKQARVIEGLAHEGLIEEPGTEDADNPFVALMREGTGMIVDEAQKNALWDQIQATKEEVAARQKKMLGQTRRRSICQALGIGFTTGAVASLILGTGFAHAAEAFSAGTGGGGATAAVEAGSSGSAPSGAAGSGAAAEGGASSGAASAEGAGSRASAAAEATGGKGAGAATKAPSTEAAAPKEAPRVRLVVDPTHSRSVQGAIIDHLKKNPEIAKQFGWNGTDDLHNWAGHRAAVLYNTHARVALTDPAVRAELKAGGYAETVEGYGEMMRRLKSTGVEINMGKDVPGDESIRLVDVDMLKARPRAVVYHAPEPIVHRMPAGYRAGAVPIEPFTPGPTTAAAESLAARGITRAAVPASAETVFSPIGVLQRLRISPEQYQHVRGAKAKDLLGIFDEVENRDVTASGPRGGPVMTDDPWYKFRKGQLPHGWPKVATGAEFAQQLRLAEAVQGYMKTHGLAGDPTVEEFLKIQDSVGVSRASVEAPSTSRTVEEIQRDRRALLDAIDREESKIRSAARRLGSTEVIPQGLSTQKQRLLEALVHARNVPPEIRVNRLLQNYAAGTLIPEDLARYRVAHGGTDIPVEKYAEWYRANLERIEQGGMGGRNAHVWMRNQFMEMELERGARHGAHSAPGVRPAARVVGAEAAPPTAPRPRANAPAVGVPGPSETLPPLPPGAEHPTTFLHPRTAEGAAINAAPPTPPSAAAPGAEAARGAPGTPPTTGAKAESVGAAAAAPRAARVMMHNEADRAMDAAAEGNSFARVRADAGAAVAASTERTPVQPEAIRTMDSEISSLAPSPPEASTAPVAPPAGETLEPTKKFPVYTGNLDLKDMIMGEELLRQQTIPIRSAADILAEQLARGSSSVAPVEYAGAGMDVEGLPVPKRDALDALIYSENRENEQVDQLLRLYMGGEIKPEDLAKYHLAHATTAFESEASTEQGLADSYAQNLEEIVKGRITGDATTLAADKATGWLKAQLSSMNPS